MSRAPLSEDVRQDIKTILTAGAVAFVWLVVAEACGVAGTHLIRNGHVLLGVPFMVVSYAMLIMSIGCCVYITWKLIRGRTNVQDH